MGWKGLSETPSNKKKLLEGGAVGLFVRYRSDRHFTSGCRKGIAGSIAIFRTCTKLVIAETECLICCEQVVSSQG